MSEPNANDIWQVDVNGAVYDAAFSELPEWIEAGSLLPGDKVRKGNLRWIEARKVPSLVPFFNAKEQGVPMPVVVTTTDASDPQAPMATVQVESVALPRIDPSTEIAAVPFDPEVCVIHLETPSSFLCDGCANGFCKACPNSYGGTVKICPFCGAMCREKEKVKVAMQQAAMTSDLVNGGFGFSDFTNALAHPIKFKVSLFFGALLFMFFTLGKGAGAMGGIYMVVGGIFAGMSANALTFGVLSHTIDNFIQGKFDENFMPDFENFEIWEDIVHPFFLSIAAYISSFGPFILTLVVAFYLITSTVAEGIDSYRSDLEKIPGTHVYNGRELVDQSGDVKEVLKGVDQRQRERIVAIERGEEGTEEFTATPTDPTPFVDQETREQEELWAAATEGRKRSLESALGKTAETEAMEQDAMIKAFLGLAAPLVVVGFITFVWGMIFFPASCAVAGYSKSFLATINPLVGLDTIKRLGVDYVKVLLMSFVLVIVSLVVSAVLSVVLAPLYLPGMGNLPAIGISAILTFYLIAVFSCILGYALFKRADRLGLLR